MAKRAVVLWPNEKAYFFSGDQFVRYDVPADRADPGFPQPIRTAWRGVLEGPSPGGPGVSAGASGPATSVRDAFIKFSEPLEARVHWMYLDVKGLVTTGVGDLIDPVGRALALPWIHADDGAAATASEISDEWQLVKSRTDLAQSVFTAFEPLTRLRLTDASIDSLVLSKFDSH